MATEGTEGGNVNQEEAPFMVYGDMVAPLGRQMRLVREEREGAPFIIVRTDEFDTVMLAEPEAFSTLDEAVARFRILRDEIADEDIAVMFPDEAV